MAAAMLSRLLAVAALVALLCGVAAAQRRPIPDVSGSEACKLVDKNVVNACFNSMGGGKQIAMADRVISSGKTIQVRVDCCVSFGGHDCLCQMKKAWLAQKNGAPNNVQCVREKQCSN